MLAAFIAASNLLEAKKTADALMHDRYDEKKTLQLLDDIIMDTLTFRPANTHFADSKEGNFRVHYDITGRNAVPSIDEDNNNIPDFIDSVLYYADYINEFYIFDLGYKPFAIDSGSGGSKAFDIYLWELGDDSLDGYGGIYGMSILDKQQIPGSHSSHNSFCVIDDDFSELDSNNGSQTFQTTNGFDALKVTLAHELHHAIQFLYTSEGINAYVFQEMTSVFYENRLFPEIKDYYQYTNKLLLNPDDYPLGTNNALAPYCYGIFFQYLYKKFGDAAIKRVWELGGNGVEHFTALNQVLESYDFSMKEAWEEFVTWMYFTGDRAKGDTLFNDAPELRALAFIDTIDYSPGREEFARMASYEFRAYRVNFPVVPGRTNDTLDILISNPNPKKTNLYSGFTDEVSWMLLNEANSETIPVPNMQYYFKYATDNPENSYKLYSMPGTIPNYIGYAYPNPYKPNESSNVYFPVPEEAFINDNVLLYIYSIDMQPLFCETLKVGISHEDRTTVALHDADRYMKEPGVYIYMVKHKKGKTLGKIAVK